MAISLQSFPPRKRRPSAASFVSPKLSDWNLLLSLLLLSKEISSMKPIELLMRRNSQSFIRKSKLLSILFEDLVRNSSFRCGITDRNAFHHSAILCFEEMYIVLQRIKALMEDCSNGSKMGLLMQNQSVSSSFHELNIELSTLLDIFPVMEIDLHEDVKECVWLIRKQCKETKPFVDPRDERIREDVVSMLNGIEKEIAPDHMKLAEVFDRLGIRDSSSCREEIENLEDEVQNQNEESSKSDLIALVGLVRYAKCVLFGASTPESTIPDGGPLERLSSDLNIPVDFRCPVTLELMRDPVVVATGQTYDRESIKLWIDSGNNTCPKTGQILSHTQLIPNRALSNLIALWCREQKIPFETAGSNDKVNSVKTCKVAVEATRMTVSFLINKLSRATSIDAANAIIYELRVLAKTDSDGRACIAAAGAIPLLVRYLHAQNSNLQVNAVTTLLNLSILEENKTKIMETDGALNGVIEVLRSGTTWESKANAAATIYSLSSVHAYRKKLGRKTRVLKGLVDLARDGSTSCKRDAMVAILNLAGDREAAAKLVEGGVVETLVEVMDELSEEAVAILEVVVKRGGFMAVASTYRAVKKLSVALREGSERARECIAATLVTICRKGGSEMVAELASMPGMERILWELMATGTVRSRRKAATLLRILRRWTAGLNGELEEGFSRARIHSSTTILVE